MIVQSRFKPHPLLRNPHLQTLWLRLTRVPPRLARERERLELPDGDFLDFDWGPSGGKKDAPLVMIFHGLTGCSRSQYVLGLQEAIRRLGWDSVALNFRGAGDTPNRLARTYHSGESGDVDYFYRHIIERFPNRPFFAVGYSMGGNVLLKWLGERHGSLCLVGAVAVSVPLVLAECARRLDQGFSRIYRRHLIGQLLEGLERKKAHLRDQTNLGELAKLEALGDLSDIQSFWEFDDRVIAPLHGFRDVHDYYAQSSSRQFLQRIEVPTLIIHALDDPFMSEAVVPGESEMSHAVRMEVAGSGGHVGFVATGGGVWTRPWLEDRIPEYLRGLAARSA